MRVLRIETETGQGPYTYREYTDEVSSEWWSTFRGFLSRSLTDAHPVPQADGIFISNRWGYREASVCGFASVEQYLDWFRFVDDAGEEFPEQFRLVEYEVHGNAVRKGGRQVMFTRTKARKIAEYDPNVVLRKGRLVNA